MTTSIWENARIEAKVDPREVILDDNLRDKLDGNLINLEEIEERLPRLVASIQAHGVRVPPIAQETADGKLWIKDGFSRTLAARRVLQKNPDMVLTMPVIVTETDDEDAWQRLRDQFVINDVRDGLTTAEKARALQQMQLFGFDEKEIAEQLALHTEHVKAGLAVQRSAKATQILNQNPQLDLLQAAAIAEFEGDTDALAELNGVLEEDPDQFDHTVAELRLRRHIDQECTALAAELADRGVTVVQRSYSGPQETLTYLKASKDATTRLSNDPEQHASCPGHAAYVDYDLREERAKPVWVCTDWKTHGHYSPFGGSTSGTGKKSEREKQELARSRVNKPAWRAAEQQRRKKLAEVLTAKTPPKKTMQFILACLVGGDHALRRAMEQHHTFVCELLGFKQPKDKTKHPLLNKFSRLSADEAIMRILAIVLGAFEGATDDDTWKHQDPALQQYFTFLRDNCGYALSEVERLVLDPHADAHNWPHLQTSADGADLPQATATTGTVAPDLDDPDNGDHVGHVPDDGIDHRGETADDSGLD